MFCNYLVQNKVKEINIEVLNSYLYNLLINEKYNKEVLFNREEIFSQLISLMYVGILHSDYEKLGKILPRTYINWYNNKPSYNIEEIKYDRFSNLIIDNSDISSIYLKRITEKNKKYKEKAELFTKQFINFYNKYLEEKNNKKKIKTK